MKKKSTAIGLVLFMLGISAIYAYLVGIAELFWQGFVCGFLRTFLHVDASAFMCSPSYEITLMTIVRIVGLGVIWIGAVSFAKTMTPPPETPDKSRKAM